MDLSETSKRTGNADANARHPWELARLKVVVDLLKDVLKEGTGLSVLDIGCGDILFVKELAKLFPGAQFYAVDTAFSPALIEKYKL